MNIGINTSSLYTQNIITEQNKINAIELLKNLSIGDEFNGKVLSVIGQDVEIRLDNGNIINATMTEDFNFNIGDDIKFAIKDNSQQQIVIKPQVNLKDEFVLIDKALDNAKIPPTDKNVDLVRELVRQNMPIDKETVTNLSKQVLKFPEAKVSDIVSLKHMGIEINADNLNQLSKYQNYEHNIKDGMVQIFDKYVKIESPIVRNAVIEHLSTDTKLPVPLKEVLTPIQREELINVLGKETSLAVEVKEGELDIKDFLNKVNTTLEYPEFEKLAQTKEYKEIIREFVRNELLLSPKQIEKEGEVSKFYEEISEKLESLAEELVKSGATKISNTVNELRSNITFLNNVNNFMAYVQLPLKLSEQEAHGDLYVFRNKKSVRDDNNVTALLHLDMDNIGALDVFISLNNNNLSTNFRLANEEVLDFIEAHMHILNERLQKLGYNVDIKTQINEDTNTKKENSLIDTFAKIANIPTVTTTRFSFDIKA